MKLRLGRCSLPATLLLLACSAEPSANEGAPSDSAFTNNSKHVLAATTHAFDTGAGSLNVDYAGFLSKHDIVYAKANTNPDYGLTVGNGRMGAMVWSNNGLTMQVSGVDSSEQTAFSAGLVNLSTSPGMDSGYSNFAQRLALYDGVLTTRYDSNRTVTIMGSPNSEVMGIHVDDSRGNVQTISLDLSLWDLSNLNNNGDVPDLNTWKTVSTYADANGAGLSRGQTDANHFGYTLAATVEGASFTTQVVTGSKVRLNITPSSSYTIWVTCASRLNAPNFDSVAQAKSLLGSVKNTGYATTLNNYKNWWHALWRKSFVQYSGLSGDADYLENVYYLSTYLIASGAYGNYPFHFINGVYRATNDNTKWSNSYWYWNQRDVYNSFLASNHADMMAVFNGMHSRNFNALKSYTQTRYGIDGIWVPETMGWDGNARGTINSDYTKNIYSTGTEAALNMVAQYRYTNDSNYLRNTAYPFMREVAKFYTAKLSRDGAGKYYMDVSNSHETYWNVRNAVTDLVAVRKMFPIAIQTASSLGLDVNLRSQWQSVLDNLVPYPNDGTDYLPHQAPIAQTRNNENVAAELIWPYSVTGIGASDYQMALNTWNHRPFPYGNVWANDAIQAARLGLGDQTYNGMKLMLGKYQNYPNGFTNNTNGVFEYHGVHLSAANEALLQSYNDKIRVFPAIPSDGSFVGRFTLYAEGGFAVSSERESGEIKYVGIKSLYGNSAKVVNPWGNQELRVRRVSDNATITTTAAAEVSFSTTANTVYVIERTAKPLGNYTYTNISGTANQGAKYLSGTSSTLGIPATPPPDTGKYEGEKAALVNCNAEGDNAASNQGQVVNLRQGSSLSFSNTITGNTLDIRYCTMNNPGRLGLYVNGSLKQTVEFPSTNSWSGTYTTKTVSVSIPASATIKLQYDAGGAGANIDYIQVR
ncbi:DUF5010 C-terminal domain-containing protein [Pendulispora rubella]|uniref:DUF5010 C-terminal domain-containing protein n=1 Tax=Pendulispora rubella TaxID=2741070 RepID=A0ABZ2LD62_9BACT